MRGARVAVTGVGVVAPCGIGTDAFWDGLGTAVEPADRRAVVGFDPEDWFDNPKEARRTDRFAQFALAAAQMALEQAGDVGADPDRVGRDHRHRRRRPQHPRGADPDLLHEGQPGGCPRSSCR